VQHRPLKQLLFRKLKISAHLALALSLVGSSFFFAAPQKVQAADGSDFMAGRIIDDFVFTNKDSMTTPDIQNFLNTKGANCTNNCLKDYTQGGKSAATIIRQAAIDYNISPQTILVLLQKEQGIVTSSAPTSYMYKYATGYCVTDSGLCGSSWGFTNQVRAAAELFRDIMNNPDSSNYPPGSRRILYNPVTSCGRKTVNVQNAATSALYHYTPYTPNGSALNNLYGEGNDCSAYGNRNFWRYFTDWFGSTLSNYPNYPVIGDWGAGAADNAGMRYGANYHYDLDNNGTVDKSFGIGRVSDGFIGGDWDDDGKDEVGLRRGNQYFFDTDNDGTAEISFKYARSTDGSFAGDWDGNGTDTIGVKRGSSYYLDNDNSSKADVKVAIGRASDKVMIGDWDGDGSDEIGLRRGNYYYLDTDNDGTAEISFGMGRTSDRVIIGDWDGDGSDEIGLRRGNQYFLDSNHDGRANIYVGMGRSTDTVLVGDWNANGTDTIGLRRYNTFFYDNDNDGSPEVSFTLSY